jgi:hypothetical protein
VLLFVGVDAFFQDGASAFFQHKDRSSPFAFSAIGGMMVTLALAERAKRWLRERRRHRTAQA